MMKSSRFQRPLIGIWLLLAALVEAGHVDAHDHVHRHHHKASVLRKEHGIDGLKLKRQDSKCEFPSDAGLVAVTPEEKNAGWALSPDRACEPDSYCPYACPPGQLMAQWDPAATSYTYPLSQNGGLHCDKDGKVRKPFPDKPYCVDGTGSLGCKNKAVENVTFCQTVLPGNEAMLIPTDVEDWAGLAVPDPSYWASTAAHYYINPPGISPEEACVWGTKESPVGNWSPYVAGANTDSNGRTFVKVGWNPVYLEPETPFRDEMPKWGVKIECEGDGCNGLPCAIDPRKHSVNQCSGTDTAGAGGATFCVVTVPKDAKANIVVFEVGGGEEKSSSKKSKQPPSSSSESPSPSPSPTPTESSSSSSSLSESTGSSESSSSSGSAETSSSDASTHIPKTLTRTRTITASRSTMTTFPLSYIISETTTSETYSSLSLGNSPHIFVKSATSTNRRSTSSTSTPTSAQAAITSTSEPRKQQNAGVKFSTSALGALVASIFTILISTLY